MHSKLKGSNPTTPKYGFTQPQWDKINWVVLITPQLSHNNMGKRLWTQNDQLNVINITLSSKFDTFTEHKIIGLGW